MEGDWSSINTLITTVGFPITIVLLLIYAGFKIAHWLAPKISDLIEEHVLLIKTLRDSSDKQTEVNTMLISKHSLTHSSIEHLADAISILSPEDKRVAIAPHIEKIKKILENS